VDDQAALVWSVLLTEEPTQPEAAEVPAIDWSVFVGAAPHVALMRTPLAWRFSEFQDRQNGTALLTVAT
jgi:hypothetical protein